MDLSIIIPSFNTAFILDRCLASVFQNFRKNKFSYEVIVIDNASTDGSAQLVARKYPQVCLIKNSKNMGYGRANNQAIRKSHGEYILLLNSDILVQGNAVGILYDFEKTKPRSFVGGKLLNEDGSVQSSCGKFYTLLVTALMLFTKGDCWGATRFSPRIVRSVDWVSGACLMGAKSAFMDVGLFDERIFLYMEEVDFLYRAKKKGYTTIFFPDACFVHSGAASSGQRRRPVVNIYQGLVYFYKKHHGPVSLAFLRLLLTIKAFAAITLGYIFRKRELIQIYEEALSMV